MQGADGKLPATAASLRQLDLTDNLVGSWGTVVSICQQLPQLRQLNLSLNRLQLPRCVPDAGLQQLPGLQCLVLNQCHVTWQQVRLAVSLPSSLSPAQLDCPLLFLSCPQHSGSSVGEVSGKHCV
jgi:hypothetical protein